MQKSTFQTQNQLHYFAKVHLTKLVEKHFLQNVNILNCVVAILCHHQIVRTSALENGTILEF